MPLEEMSPPKQGFFHLPDLNSIVCLFQDYIFYIFANYSHQEGFFNILSLLFSLVDYVPVKDEIIWYLSLTAWLISLSIMLSSSIHAVAKGISSFFLSAA